MAKNDTLAVVQDILGPFTQHDPSTVTPATTFAELGLDSMTTLEVIVAAEDRFEMIIPDEVWSRFTTIGDAIGFVERASVLG
jgi:acyl carrier protein